MTDRGPDPTYTSTRDLPHDDAANGRCSLCGCLVLDFGSHTTYHQEIWEAFSVLTLVLQRPEPLGPPDAQAIFGGLDD